MCTPTERSITAENKNKGREMETQLQKSLDEPDELLEAQAEVRHLRETTLILREELEAQRYEKDAAVQGARNHPTQEQRPVLALTKSSNSADEHRDQPPGRARKPQV